MYVKNVLLSLVFIGFQINAIMAAAVWHGVCAILVKHTPTRQMTTWQGQRIEQRWSRLGNHNICWGGGSRKYDFVSGP